LERENRLLEKELENLVTLKNQATQDSTNRTRSEDQYQTMDTRNLHKIDEDNNEEHESYCYSNSEDEGTGIFFLTISKMIGKKPKRKEKEKEKEEHEHFVLREEYPVPDIRIEEMVVPDPEERDESPKADFSLSPKGKKLPKIRTIEDSISPDKIKTKQPISARNSNNKENQGPQNSGSKSLKSSTSAILKASNAVNLSVASGSSKKEKAKPSSPPKYEKMDKATSLEYRLMGANKAIKSLENQLKLKDEKIQELLKEIDKKNKVIELQQSNSLNVSQVQKSSQNKESLTSIMKKKEKQLEKKVKDQEVIINENKKYMIRLQDLNAKILQKIKEVEDENTQLKKKEENYEQLKQLEEENKQLKERLAHTEGEREQIVNINEEYDKKYEKMIKLYSDVEEKSEKFIQKNKGLNDLLLNLITTYHNRDKLVHHS
jgi:hypothetical protein